MPLYSYTCESNGETLQVIHPMREQMKTWGQLCERAGQDLNGTPADAPVTRMMSRVQVISSNGGSGGHGNGGCCGVDGCG